MFPHSAGATSFNTPHTLKWPSIPPFYILVMIHSPPPPAPPAAAASSSPLPPDGDYEFTIPGDTPTGLYAVRVARFQTGSPADCSEPFQVSRIDSGIEQSGNAARLSQDVDGGSGSESHGESSDGPVNTGGFSVPGRG